MSTMLDSLYNWLLLADKYFSLQASHACEIYMFNYQVNTLESVYDLFEYITPALIFRQRA
jgi:hypothetical protein